MIALAFSGGKDSMACLHLQRGELDCAIYIDTGYSYPETDALVEYAAEMLPVHRVKADRAAQWQRLGVPSSMVPIDWTDIGQAITSTKAIMVQSYLGCCFENIGAPIMAAAKALGVTHLVYGQRNEENHKSLSRNGTVVDGIVRLHPIEDWTTQDVLDYLATKMTVPEHYRTVKHSSLDCYDCTGYRKDSADRVEWMRTRHPEFYFAYAKNRIALDNALMEAANG